MAKHSPLPSKFKVSPIHAAAKVPVPAAAAKAKQQTHLALVPIEAKIKALSEIQSPEEYQEMDAFLGTIQTMRRAWKEKMEPIIRPIRQGLDGLYALNREIDTPLEKAEKSVKSFMEDWKREELRQARLLEQEQAQERQRLADEQAALEERLAKARTNTQRQSILAKQEELTEESEQVESTMFTRTTATNSGARTIPSWRNVNMTATLQGILRGEIPMEAIMLDVPAINAVHKVDPELVTSWPGFEGYEAVQIVGRR